MLEKKISQLDRAQLNLLFKPKPFALLREAKLLISDEFSKELVFNSKDILNQIYELSKESKSERLFDIFHNLQQYIEVKPQVESLVDEKISSISKTPTNTQSTKIKVGDIIDGKRCTGLYRGQPVFDED